MIITKEDGYFIINSAAFPLTENTVVSYRDDAIVQEFDSEELMTKVLSGEIDYTIIDSNNLAINRSYYPEISIGFSIAKPQSLAWMVSKNSHDDILASLMWLTCTGNCACSPISITSSSAFQK